MTLTVRSLASGSSGNALLVRTGTTVVLVDCGLSLLRLRKHLAEEGITPRDIDAVVLSHEHTDHTSGISTVVDRHATRVYATRGTLAATPGLAGYSGVHPVAFGEIASVGDLNVSLFPIPHDAAEPAGVTITHAALGKKISILTDAGMVTPAVREALRGSDLIVLESNHDVARLIRGPYPARLKARIRGGRGHLSNEECARLIADLAGEHPALTVWLAHLSEENNTPALALKHAQTVLRECNRVNVRLEIAHRDKPSAMWRPGTQTLQLQLIFV